MKKLLLSALVPLLAVCPLSAGQLVPSKAVQHSNFPKFEKAVAAAETPSESDIYNITMLCKENFDKFTAGSTDAPDQTVLDGEIDAELTEMPGWTAYYVYQAGGCVLIDRSKNSNANLCSPILNLPLDKGPVTVSFRARLAATDMERDWVEVYVADCTGVTDPSKVRTFANDYAYVYNEWRDYSFTFTKQRKGTDFFFQFGGYDAPVFVDDIEIKFLEPKLEAPVASGHSDFTDSSFKANWSAVDGADAYLVSLFTINDDRDKTRNYLVEDLRVTECSHTFTDLETPTTTFYYVVKAVKGDAVSPESNVVKVHALTMPQNIVITKADGNNIKVTWDAVKGAEYYIVEAFRAHEAKADETYTLCYENFDKLVCDGTYLEPEVPYQKQEELDEFTEQPGWIAQCPLHINGAYGLAGYYAKESGTSVFMSSPILDLSAAGGKINVTADLYGQKVYEDDICNATFRTMKYVTVDGQEAIVYTDGDLTGKIPEEWTPVSFTLGGGTPRSILQIITDRGALYIDNIKITQDLKAGEKVSVPYTNARPETNEVLLPVNDLLRGSDIVVRVQAVREIWDSMHFSVNEYVRSPFTADYSFSVATSGINDIAAEGVQPKAFAADGVIRVVNPGAGAVCVYDMTGRLVAEDRSGSQLVDLPVSAAGIYAVRVADKTIKVVR